MILFPAIDLFEKKAVRLQKGDYDKMTVYSDNPLSVAKGFELAGAKFIHMVDLEGAKYGTTPNLDVVKSVCEGTGLDVEIGGGIRDEATIEKYLSAGVRRVILGTVAVENPEFLKNMVEKYGDKIAVGVDIKDGFVATHGWIKASERTCFEFCTSLQKIGVKTIIVTDISKDGLLSGTNLSLYRDLSKKVSIDIVASGGVKDISDIKKLKEIGLYGAILGKAIYTGNIDLKSAIEEAGK